MTTHTLTDPKHTLSTDGWLDRKGLWGISAANALLVAIILLSLSLHLINLQAIGDANTYYTAAVKSMLQSWHNFFFVAAEPGASVTVDKPPLGLWIEAAFAYVLGVSGFSVSLPNILAGVWSVPLLYHLVKKYAGSLAGLIAALVMAVTPVVAAADRNNTMDGMLTFTLLLAAWAFINAAETGKLRHLLLGAFIIGLGFNIKMMQAFLPLPAFYALYFFGARSGWLRKTFYLGLATFVLLAVSLSWALVVDSIPAGQRPYIGSSENNTVMELISGHNGLSRLFGPGGADGNQAPNSPDGGPGDDQGNGQVAGLNQPAADDDSRQAPSGQNGLSIQPPAGGSGAGAANGPDGGQGGGPGGSGEVGAPGLLRFFQAPLAKEMSWMLPFALLGLSVALFTARLRLPLKTGIHRAAVLWGGWLLTCLVFFSIASFFHAYYMIMLAPALGACVGIAFAALWQLAARRPSRAAMLLLACAGLTLAFQVYLTWSFNVSAWWMLAAGLIFVMSSQIFTLAWLDHARRSAWHATAYAAILGSILIIPLAWSLLTVASPSQNVNLPSAYAGEGQNGPDGGPRFAAAPDGGGLPPGPANNPTGLNTGANNRPPLAPNNFSDAQNTARPGLPPGSADNNPAGANADANGAALDGPNPGSTPGSPKDSGLNQELLAYLQAHTQDTEYLLAVPSAFSGAPYILATGRPVLYMGGFSGRDPVVDADDLRQMVASGELRYILYDSQQNGGPGGPPRSDIAQWLAASCTLIPQFSQGTSLYECH